MTDIRKTVADVIRSSRYSSGVDKPYVDEILEICKREVEAEREACARLVEANTDFMMLQDFGLQSTCDQLKVNIAAEIRARTKKDRAALAKANPQTLETHDADS